MRVAVVFPFPLEEGHLGKDLFLIPEGLRREGFEVELHCPRAEPGVAWPLEVVEAGPGGLARSEQYAGRGLEAAVVFSYLHYAPLLAAVRGAGLRVVAKGDTTGESVVRAHPAATLRHAWFDRPTPAGRARGLAEWTARAGPLARRDHRALTTALELADVTVVETLAAREAVRTALSRRGDERLLDRVRVIPNPVADVFTRGPVPAERERTVVAIGRWDIAAKGGRLLGRTLDRFLRDHPDQRAVVIGAGGEGLFGARVHRPGRLGQEEIVELLGRARTVVVASHWESFSLSSHEALALGCTVVGPPLAPLRDVVAAGPFGTLGARSPAGLADALAREAAAWDRGERDPAAIAAHWRARLDVGAVGQTFAGLLTEPASPAGPRR